MRVGGAWNALKLLMLAATQPPDPSLTLGMTPHSVCEWADTRRKHSRDRYSGSQYDTFTRKTSCDGEFGIALRSRPR